MNNAYIFIGIAAVGVAVLGTKNVIDLKQANENEKRLAPFIKAMEEKHGIKSGVLHKLLKAESAFRTDIIDGKTRSSTGAMGIAQFMPLTAREWLGNEANALVPEKAIEGAAKYLKWLYVQMGQDWTKAVASYNWGLGNVRKKGLASAPKETRNYVKKILGVTV